jgi:hypothetical protein
MSFSLLSSRSSARPSRSLWLSIIGTLTLLLSLGGCTTVRLAYNNATSLTTWWLDGYFDLDTAQSAQVRGALQNVQDWHRKEELPAMAQQLADLKVQALRNIAPAQACQFAADAQLRFQAAALRMATALAPVAATLSTAQLAHLDRELDKRDDQWKRDYLEATRPDRLERSAQRMTERMESFYGRLTPVQRDLVRAQVAELDFDGQVSYRERLRRHQDILQVLGQSRNASGSPQALLSGLLQRSFASPDVAYRQQVERLTRQACGHVAALHNSMDADQRGQLLETLSAYERDLRTLASQP